MNVSKMPM